MKIDDPVTIQSPRPHGVGKILGDSAVDFDFKRQAALPALPVRVRLCPAPPGANFCRQILDLHS